MTWVTWRQHRTGVVSTLTGLVVVIVGMVVLGWLDSRAPIQSSSVFTMTALDQAWVWTKEAFFVVPAIAGIFVGAPLLARDFERGTHRLAWTQGISRGRWLAEKLCNVVIAVMLGSMIIGTVSLLVFDSALSHNCGLLNDQSQWDYFDVMGPALAAYVLFAVTLGIALGALLRQSIASMVLTGIGYLVVRLVVGLFLRPRYLPPLYHSGPMSAVQSLHDWIVGQSGSAGAGFLFQPANRFWTFQLIEAAIFVALALILLVFTFLITLRREA